MHLLHHNKKSPALGVWRWQIGQQLRIRRCLGPRGLAVVWFDICGKTSNTFFDSRRLRICILHDLFSHYCQPQIRFAVYRAGQVPWGISLGGREQLVFETDLCLPPRRRGYGRRFSFNDQRWLPLALKMERCLTRHSRHPHAPRANELRLPKFWTAINTREATGDGPEFAELVRRFRLPSEVALACSARRHRGEVFHRMEFVSNRWEEFRAIYCDFKGFFRRQVLVTGQEQLVGFEGAAQFDLLGSVREWRSI
jgi:hypothetical protein